MVKVIIDLIEELRAEINNQGDFTFLAMLLKEDESGDMQLVGEKAISRVGIVANELIFYVDVKERIVFVGPVLKMIDELENSEMMMEVKVSVSEQKFDIVGFGKAEKEKHFVIFIEAK